MTSDGGSSFVSYSLAFAEAFLGVGSQVGCWSGGDRWASGAGRWALSVRKVVDGVRPRRNETTHDMGCVMRDVTLVRRVVPVVFADRVTDGWLRFVTIRHADLPLICIAACASL